MRMMMPRGSRQLHLHIGVKEPIEGVELIEEEATLQGSLCLRDHLMERHGVDLTNLDHHHLLVSVVVLVASLAEVV